VTELENDQQKFRNGWRGWLEFLLPLRFGHYNSYTYMCYKKNESYLDMIAPGSAYTFA